MREHDLSEKKQRIPPKIVVASLMAFVIIVLCIGALLFGAFNKLYISCSIASVGIISFLGVLMLTNYLSNSRNLNQGEMRKALTVSFTAVYFSLISLLTFKDFPISEKEIAQSITGHFTYLIGIIIVFYFGSSAMREYLNSVKKG